MPSYLALSVDPGRFEVRSGLTGMWRMRFPMGRGGKHLKLFKLIERLVRPRETDALCDCLMLYTRMSIEASAEVGFY